MLVSQGFPTLRSAKGVRSQPGWGALADNITEMSVTRLALKVNVVTVLHTPVGGEI